MTYYYSKISGLILTTQHIYTAPINNILYQIIIIEAAEHNIRPIMTYDPTSNYHNDYDTLFIRYNNISIYFCSHHIIICKGNLRNGPTNTIPYEQYTNLKQLIETHT